RRLVGFEDECRKILEDGLEMRCEFTNCAGDLSTVSWVSNQTYLAGTTVHMDSHNQQYNKPGNLVLGSVARGSATLKAYPDHRIPRPLVERGENSTEAMRESQSPWLYTSVVSSDYDRIHNRIYSSGFDKKVKVWKVDSAGASMRCIGTWEHEGPVNFVQASLFDNQDEALVATAADVPTNAVRVYHVSKDDRHVAQSRFKPFSCSRIVNSDGTPMVIDKWTYFPSTMRWGIEQSVKHLLLVGYSPRSLTGDDNDIPTDRSNTGELCLWDAVSGKGVTITSARTQNVFEVLWHPTQPVFIAATSPAGYALNFDRVKTQVRIFKQVVDNGHSTGLAFTEMNALDCYAVDINELTIMPNSPHFCFVTAGCTDGKTYVWDTALGDKPVQVLAHGQPVAGVTAGDDTDDTGVKFTAWGTSMDRFYTGSSDGIVKVWNVRSLGKKAKGRVILEAPAQISFGAFSPDKSKLVIGDASGRVFVLSTDHDDGSPPSFVKLPGGVKKRAPTTITPHADPPPPRGVALTDGRALGRRYVANGQLRYSGDPTVGMVKDMKYAETGLYCREAYLGGNTLMPVQAHFEAYLQ
ncbi:WD40 repeat-like protein, partial [Cryphonectria parasitica EP155]